MFCSYYQAHVQPQKAWFVVAILKSFEHMLFDRTLDVGNSIFEFYVSPSAEPYFLEVMAYMQQQGYVLDLKKLPNRLADTAAQL